MREFMERDLAWLDLVAIFIDGIEFKGHLIVVALGLDKGGKKHVLGLWQGATENATVCTSLLEDIARRGLNTQKNYLFVLDGSKTLRSAVAKDVRQHYSCTKMSAAQAEKRARASSQGAPAGHRCAHQRSL